jgi:hypothetical protein
VPQHSASSLARWPLSAISLARRSSATVTASPLTWHSPASIFYCDSADSNARGSRLMAKSPIPQSVSHAENRFDAPTRPLRPTTLSPDREGVAQSKISGTTEFDCDHVLPGQIQCLAGLNWETCWRYGPQRPVSLVRVPCSKRTVGSVLHRKSRTVTAICGGVAVLALAVAGVGDLDRPLTSAMSASSGVAPAPPSPGGSTGGSSGGALPVQPVGGGGCIIGLNCGCTRHQSCPTPHARAGTQHDQQHAAPGAQNP